MVAHDNLLFVNLGTKPGTIFLVHGNIVPAMASVVIMNPTVRGGIVVITSVRSVVMIAFLVRAMVVVTLTMLVRTLFMVARILVGSIMNDFPGTRIRMLIAGGIPLMLLYTFRAVAFASAQIQVGEHQTQDEQNHA